MSVSLGETADHVNDNATIVLEDAWEACKDADVLLESPSAMAGVHIAEALGRSTLMNNVGNVFIAPV